MLRVFWCIVLGGLRRWSKRDGEYCCFEWERRWLLDWPVARDNFAVYLYRLVVLKQRELLRSPQQWRVVQLRFRNGRRDLVRRWRCVLEVVIISLKVMRVDSAALKSLA